MFVKVFGGRGTGLILITNLFYSNKQRETSVIVHFLPYQATKAILFAGRVTR